MTSPPSRSLPSPVSDRDRTVLLAGILLALFLAALDQTIVSTALPRIVEDLEGVSRYAWVATAYMLASTALVPVYGKLADSYSRKHVELGAVVLFLVGSALCGLSGEFGTLPILGDGMRQLVIFRGIQGAGAAGLMAMTFIVIADLFTPAERGRYQGLVGAVWGIASLLGPLVGGLLTDHAGGLIPGVEGWRWVFYVNMPLGLVALWFIVRRMPRLEPPGGGGRPDLWGAAYLVAGLVPLVMGLQLERHRHPWLPGVGAGADPRLWESWLTLGLLALAAVMLVAFWRRARSVPSPILDLGLFGNVVFRRANAFGFFSGAVFMSVVIFLPLFLVNALGVSATRAGAALIPYTLGLVVASTVSGHLVSRIGHLRDLVVGSGFVLLAALVVLARLDGDVSYATVAVTMVFAGLGMGPAMPLFTLAIQNAVDVRRLGQATTAAQFFRQIGATVGAAVMGGVLAGSITASFSHIEMPASISTDDALSVERMAATGGGALPDRVRERYAALEVEVREAVLTADLGALDALSRVADAPPEVAAALAGLAASGMPPGAVPDAALPALANGLARQVADAGEERARRVAAEVREAFVAATRRIYLLALGLMAVAQILALRVPEIPLRRTHDRVVVAE